MCVHVPTTWPHQKHPLLSTQSATQWDAIPRWPSYANSRIGMVLRVTDCTRLDDKLGLVVAHSSEKRIIFSMPTRSSQNTQQDRTLEGRFLAQLYELASFLDDDVFHMGLKRRRRLADKCCAPTSQLSYETQIARPDPLHRSMGPGQCSLGRSCKSTIPL